MLNGVIVGLAGITPASGYIDPQYAVIIGAILGFASYFSIFLFKHKLRLDDALVKSRDEMRMFVDVSSVHGITGIVG